MMVRFSRASACVSALAAPVLGFVARFVGYMAVCDEGGMNLIWNMR